MFYADLFRAEQTRFCGETGIVIVDEFEQFEIDEPWELLLANAICPLAEGAS
jgi:CMP-N-acetylneuraminic acid synthetase